MNELINVQIETKEGINVVSSRVVAKELGKQHKHVLESIKKISPNLDPSYFIESVYLDKYNREKREILLTRDGFTLYMFNIQGYNDFKMAYINRFNEMERELQELKPQISLKQQLQLAILNGGELERIQALGEYTTLITEEVAKPLLDKIEEDKPLVTFADRVIKQGDNILIRDLAKIICDEGFKIGEKRLYNLLRDWGYICKKKTTPTQRGIESEYFIVQTGIVKTPYGAKQTFTTKATPKGQVHIVERILKECVEKSE